MTEEELKQRNKQMLQQVYPALRPKIAAVLQDLRGHGLRPRIQEAWRSQSDQARAYATGHSSVTWSFHCATGANDTPEALAVDILDDDNPENTGTRFSLLLASSARVHDLNWGGVWGLTKRQRDIVWKAVTAKNWEANIRLGWDTPHVEVSGLTLAAARSGTRPKLMQ